MALLRTKPLKSITVKELTDLADVNRATFYAHYSDVFDMAGQLRSSLRDVFRSLVEAHADELERGRYRGLLADIFAYFDKNEEALSVVLGPNADGSFLNDIIEVVRTASMQAVASASGRDGAPDPFVDAPALCNYHFYFLAGGVSSILKTWVDHGRTEPIDVMVDVANAYVTAVMGQLEPNVELFRRAGLTHDAATAASGITTLAIA